MKCLLYPCVQGSQTFALRGIRHICTPEGISLKCCGHRISLNRLSPHTMHGHARPPHHMHVAERLKEVLEASFTPSCCLSYYESIRDGMQALAMLSARIDDIEDSITANSSVASRRKGRLCVFVRPACSRK